MARIRTIKPEFPQSESIGKLSRDSRLLFILLWTIVDDEGRFRAASRMLASLLYPYDDDAARQIEKWLTELERNNNIRRYVVEGSMYGEVVNWLKHQKIDRPSKSRLPACPGHVATPLDEPAEPREPSRVLAADLGPRTLDHGPLTGDPDSPAIARATAAMLDGAVFEKFWRTYPKRDGANPKEPARKKFMALLRSGVVADDIISGACGYAEECRRKQQVGTQFVARALTWLNESRWKDYLPTAEDAAARAAQDEQMAARGYVWIEGSGWTKKTDK